MTSNNKKISLRNKIGAMLMFGFRGIEHSDDSVQEIIKDIKNYNLGGVILFKYNIVSPKQLSSLTDSFKQANSKLLISVDQEGGKVQRLNSKNGFKDTDSAKNISEHYTLNEAYQAYNDMAKMLKTNGINFNFAPVVDVDTQPACSVIGDLERSYSSDVSKVIQYARQFINAHRDQDVLTAVKHFPGHGFAKGDTHKGITDVTDLANPDVELKPYEELLIDSTHISVMTAHIVNRNLDSEGFPATLSQKIISGVLRKQLDFQGVVVTDALEMAAIRNHYSLEEVVVRAINAGNDILVFSRNSAASLNDDKDDSWNTTPQAIVEIIETAVADGKISKHRIEESYERISNFVKVIV
jgi:beta-N-acetylhexosaminidase